MAYLEGAAPLPIEKVVKIVNCAASQRVCLNTAYHCRLSQSTTYHHRSSTNNSVNVFACMFDSSYLFEQSLTVAILIAFNVFKSNDNGNCQTLLKETARNCILCNDPLAVCFYLDNKKLHFMQ